MPAQQDIEREVEATLRSFETEPRLADDPGFYAALRRRIRAEEAAVRPAFGASFRRRVLVPALLALMVALNIVTALAVEKARRTGTADRESGLTALVQTYAAEQAEFASYLK
jgi:hypothetical protein